MACRSAVRRCMPAGRPPIARLRSPALRLDGSEASFAPDGSFAHHSAATSGGAAVRADTCPCDSGASVARILLRSFLLMTRKTLALTIALLISSLAPATAVIGFCARMPCCEHKAGTVPQPVLTTERADCCTTINCYEAPSQDLTVKDSAKASVAAAPTISAVAVVDALPAHPRLIVDDASPPKTLRERLSTLSALLI